MSAVAPLESSPRASGSTLVSENNSEKDFQATNVSPKDQALPGKKSHLRRAKAEDVMDVDRSASPNRLKTFLNAFRYLRSLSQKQVDDFMASYLIYSLDWADEKQMLDVLGPNYQEKVGDCLKAYYGVLNHLCALGDVEKMYIPPHMDSRASVLDNQLLYEESIARHIGAKKGDRILDLGCGRGRVAAHIAKFSGAHVTGLNIDPNQVAQARSFNKERGYGNDFIVRDMNQLPLPFEDATFDGFYEIQALSLCKNLPKLFAEAYRVLKPGARLSILDWVSLPDYDPSNPEHVELMSRVKPLIGAVGTPTPASLERDLQEAGFTVIRSDNASIDGLQAPLIDRVDIYFRAMRRAILGMVKMGMLPRHFKTLINRFCLDGQAFVKMDNMRLMSTSYRVVAQKPLDEKPEALATPAAAEDAAPAA